MQTRFARRIALAAVFGLLSALFLAGGGEHAEAHVYRKAAQVTEVTLVPDTAAVRALYAAVHKKDLYAITRALEAGADPNATVAIHYSYPFG